MCEVDEEIQHEGRAFLIGLHDEADTVPARQCRVETQSFEQIERELQPVGLLRIDVQADLIGPRERGQPDKTRQQLRHHPAPLRARIARMQGGKFDGNPSTFVNPAAARRLADGVDRLLYRRGDNVPHPRR